MKVKMNKRIFSMILALFMLISVCVPGNFTFAEGETTTIPDPAHSLNVELEFTGGGTYDETKGAYVWEADSPNKGHRFYYTIRLNLSGVGYDQAPDDVNVPQNAVKIEIPLHILKLSSGEYSDGIELSVPSIDELPSKDGKYLTDHIFAYKIEGDKCIIETINTINAGEVYEIPFAYYTTSDTYNYKDMDVSDACQAKASAFTWSDTTHQTDTLYDNSSEIKVAIDTSVELTKTTKNVVGKNGIPTLLSLDELRDSEAGLDAIETAGDLEDGYYYVLWDVTSTIGKATQKYYFTVDENTLADLTLSGEDKDGNAHNVAGKVIGIKHSGTSSYVSGNTSEDRGPSDKGYSATGKRTDRVLVRYPKTVGDVTATTVDVGIDDLQKFSKPAEYKATNTVQTNIIPADEVDPVPTPKDATAVWKYDVNDPEYEGPVEQYSSIKYGLYNNGSKVTNENNITSYELDNLISDTPTSISDLGYKADVSAYAYSKTAYDLNHEIREMTVTEGDQYIEITCGEGTNKTVYKYDKTISGNTTYYVNDVPQTHTQTLNVTELKRIAGLNLAAQYGGNDVIYSLEDKTLELINPSDDKSAVTLSGDDYRIDSISYTIKEYGVEYDDQEMKYNYTDVTYDDSDKLDFYVYKEGAQDNEQLVATYHLSTGVAEIVDSTVVSAFGSDSISFKSAADVTGFRMQTENMNYYTAMTANPSVTLLPSDNVKAYVKDIVDVKKKNKVGLRNTAVWSVRSVADDAGAKKYSSTIKGTDYIAKVIRKSKIDKKWLGDGDTYIGRDGNTYGTKNDVINRLYTVGWATRIYETAQGLDGTESTKNVRQASGKVYDLLPAHSDIVEGSVMVYADGKPLPSSSYTIHPRISNYNDSERKLLTIDINAPCDQEYVVKYETVHAHEDLQDYSSMAINAIAYQTGNADIGEGYPDDGGKDNYTLHDYMIGLDPDNGTAKRFIYDEDKVDIMALMQTSSGIYKKVTTADNPSQSKSAVVHQGEEYTYNIRMKNSPSTRAYDIAVLDSIERYEKGINSADTNRKCDWYGELVGFDLSGLEEKMELAGYKDDLRLFLYVGDNPINLQDDETFSDNDDRKAFLKDLLVRPKGDIGADGWINVNNWRDLSSINLSDVKAFIVYTGKDFMLDKGDSTSFTVTMRAPSTTPASSTGDDGYEIPPSTYNNIYRSFTNKSVDRQGVEGPGVYFYSHYDYTDVSFKTTGRLSFSKVDTKDSSVKVEGAKFRVTGTSDYGTVVDSVIESDAQGHVVLEGLEKGVYTMVEEEADPDHRVDTTPRKVKVTPNGKIMVVTIESFDGASASTSSGETEDIAGNRINVKTGEFLDTDIKSYEIGNEPRIHGSVSFKKLNKFTSDGVYGAEFRLFGSSDYGNNVDETATSTVTGEVTFEDIEIGTYTLVETKAPDGFQPDTTTHTVKVVEGPGLDPIITISGTVLSKNGETTIYNTPYTKLDIYKISAITEAGLENAVFKLEPNDTETAQAVSNAVSADPNTKWVDDGTSYKQEYTNGNVGPTGEYLFDNLVAGTYKLTETPPDGYAASYTEHIITVTEKADGYSIRFSPDKDSSPDKDEDIEYDIFDAGTSEFIEVTDKDKATCYRIRNKETYDYKKDVIKSWVGNPIDTGFPVMHLSTEKPAGDNSKVTIGENLKTLIGSHKADMTGFEMSGELPSGISVDTIPDGWMDNDARETGHFFAWWDNDAKKIKWWSDAMVTYLPRDCSSLFADCNNASFTSLNLSSFYVDKVTTFDSAFKNCTNLATIQFNNTDGSNFANGQKITSLKSMFDGCSALIAVDIRYLKTTGVDDLGALSPNSLTDTSYMFHNCSNIASIHIDGLNTSAVEDMSYMFGMDNNKQNTALVNLDTSHITAGNKLKYVTGMFKDCIRIEGLDLRGFGTCPYLETIEKWFWNCWFLKYIDLSNFETSKDGINSLNNIKGLFKNVGNKKDGSSDINDDHCIIFAKTKWVCLETVTTDDDMDDCYRIRLYDHRFKNSTKNTSTGFKQGNPNHLDIVNYDDYLSGINAKKQGTYNTFIYNGQYNNKDSRIFGAYFSDASSTYYANWARQTYLNNNPTQPSGNDPVVTPSVTVSDTYPGYSKSGDPKSEESTTATSDDVGKKTFTFEYKTASTGTPVSGESGAYLVDEYIVLTVTEIVEGDDGKFYSVSQDYTYNDNTLKAKWTQVDNTAPSQWYCEMQVNQDSDFYAWEDKVSGYASTALEANPLEVPKGTTPTITNSSDPVGGLDLSKTLVDEAGTEIKGKDETPSFWFKVEMKKNDDSPYAVAPFDASGVTYVKVAAGKHVILGGIPVGCKYSVTEVTDPTDTDHPMPEGYKAYTGDVSPKAGTITANTNDPVNLKNEIIKKDLTITKTAKLWDEKIKDGTRTEVTSGTDYDKWIAEDFEFTIKLSGLCVETEYSYSIKESDDTVVSNHEFTSTDEGTWEKTTDLKIKNGQKIVFNDVPYGTEYLVTETTEHADEENVKYETLVNVNGGTDTETKSKTDVITDDQTVNYTNNKINLISEKISVVVEKKWLDESGATIPDDPASQSELPDNIYVYVGRYAIDEDKHKITSPEFAVARSVVWPKGDHSEENWKHTFKDLDKSVEIDGKKYDYYYFVAESPVNGFEQIAVNDTCVHTIGENEFIYEEDDVSTSGVYKRTITNKKLQTAPLTIDKVVDGNFASRDKKFNITIYLTDKNGDPLTGENFVVEKTNDDGTSNKQTKFFDGSPLRITLSHGDSYKFHNLPVGTRYVITEADYSTESYKASVKLGEGAWEDNKRSISGSISDENEVNIHFKNTRSGIIPTGVYINVIIPGMLFIISVFGAYVFMMRSKRWKKRLARG